MRQPQPDVLSTCRWMPVKNDSGLPIPPFAAMMVTGMDDEGRFLVDRPNANSLVDVLVNGAFTIDPDESGMGTRSEPLPVLYETSDGTPATDEDWGTSTGSWKLSKNQTGFRHIGATSGNTAWFSFLGPGGLMTVEDDDGTPSYPGIHTLQFDQGDGFSLSNPSPGVVRVDLSGAGDLLTVQESDESTVVTPVTIVSFEGTLGNGPFTVADTGGGVATVDIVDATFLVKGVVNASHGQVFGGHKIFGPGIGVLTGTVTGGPYTQGSTNNAGITFFDSITPTETHAWIDVPGTGDLRLAATANSLDKQGFLEVSCEASNSLLIVTAGGSDYSVGTYPGIRLVARGGATVNGATGTDAAGSTYQSGIVTSISSTLPADVVTTTSIDDASVTLAKMADLAGLTVIGRIGGTTGVPQAITASTQYTVLQYDGSQIGWGQVNIASTNAVTGTLAIGNGGTGQSSNTKGDLLVGTGTIWSKRAVGTNGYVLTADSTETDGVKWANSVAPAGVGWTDPISLDFSNFSTGATTNTINTGYTLPAGGVLLGAVLKTTEAFGGGSITSYSLDLVVNGNNFISAYDGFAAVSGTNFAWEGEDSPYAGPVDFGSTTAIQIKATASHNLDTATAGAVTVYLKVSTLP